MHRLLFVLLATQGLSSLRADSWTEVPESRSPDNKYALFYQHVKDTAGGTNPPYTLYFLDLHHSPASAQLIPDLRGKTTYDDDGTSAQMLLGEIAARSESLHAGKRVDADDPAAEHEVRWTADSRWVSVEGGSHKFWYMEAWRLTKGRFEQVNLSRLDESVKEYFNNPKIYSPIQALGMDKKIKAIGNRYYDPYVDWLSDGVFAVNGYPFLLNDPEFDDIIKSGETYFLIDCHDIKAPKVIGLCQ